MPWYVWALIGLVGWGAVLLFALCMVRVGRAGQDDQLVDVE